MRAIKGYVPNIVSGIIISYFSTSQSYYLAVGLLPLGNALQQVAEIERSTELRSTSGIKDAELCIGAGIPPIPPRLVTRIQSGEFIDMADLLPDQLAPTSTDRTSKPRRQTISNILEWVKCFSAYIAVVSSKQPDRVPDLLGYMTLIIESHMEHAGEGWMGYDRRFRQIAATKPNMVWAQIDTTLWNLAFSGKARAVRCKFCFSLSHVSAQCNLAPDHGLLPSGTNQQQPPTQPNAPYTRQPQCRRICMLYNNEPSPGCSFPDCKFEHVCCLCADDPHTSNKDHKAVMCPHYSNRILTNRDTPSTRWQAPMPYRRQPYYR